MRLTILQGDVFERMKDVPDGSIDLVITSPPYWGLRAYGGGAAELGAEPTMEAYLDHTMRWVKEVWRVLKPTGSFVLNIGDCFIGGGGRENKLPEQKTTQPKLLSTKNMKGMGGFYKIKQLLSVSSFAYCRIVSETDFVCRGEHIWAKPNVPTPIRSRLKHSHEKLFWFVKDADKYYFDSKAWMKKVTLSTTTRLESIESYNLPDGNGKAIKPFKTRNNTFEFPSSINVTPGKRGCGMNNEDTIEHSWRVVPVGAKQSGFELNGKVNSEHIAPFPENLIEPYIKSLCPHEGIVLDPFLGSGTTMRVAMENGRNALGIELSAAYIAYAKKRLNWGGGLNVEYLEKI